MLFRSASSSRNRFEKLTEGCYSSLLGTALRLTRDREEASDLAQEAVVRAFEAFDRFDGTNFKAWILRILTNLYINRYRQKKRQKVAGSLDDDEMMMEPMAPAEIMPDRQLLDEMLGYEIEEALSRIPDVFRIAVILSDVEQMSYDEIATVLDVPVGTVRSRIARGRAALRQQLLEYATERGYLRQKGEIEI
jgi:RNA polymerase sigma-70 factor, ECF subfamily